MGLDCHLGTELIEKNQYRIKCNRIQWKKVEIGIMTQNGTLKYKVKPMSVSNNTSPRSLSIHRANKTLLTVNSINRTLNSHWLQLWHSKTTCRTRISSHKTIKAMAHQIEQRVGKPGERSSLSRTISTSRSKWVSNPIRLLQLAAMVHLKQE